MSKSFDLDYDDEDRQHYYRQYGKDHPERSRPAVALLRRSRLLNVALVGIGCLFLLWLLGGTATGSRRVDWHKFAYSLYATDTQSLCNALLVFEALKRVGSKADRVLIVPQEWDTTVHSATDRESQLLKMAQDKYGVTLYPVQLLGENGATPAGSLNSDSSWDTSITKLVAFDLIYHDRVLHLDSDLTLLRNLDHLFLLPPAPIAMPRAYWSDMPPPSDDQAQPWPLTSMLMLLQPSRLELKYLLETLTSWRVDRNFTSGKKYDMDLLNYRFGSSAMVLPHRPYALLTAEFRHEDHSTYLGLPPSRSHGVWNAQKILDEAYVVHFSDWPLPKPWTMWSPEALAEMQPNCTRLGGESISDCAEKRIWKGLYEDFRKQRRDVCKILSVPATNWKKWKTEHGAG